MLVVVVLRWGLGCWRPAGPVMPPVLTRVHVLTGGSLIERIYSPAADQLSRARQSDLSWRNDKPKGWLAS